MAIPIVRYQARDGSVWNSEAAADRRDRLNFEVAQVMAGLTPRPKALEDNKGYLQHSAASVLNVSRLLMSLAAPFLGADWMQRQRAKHSEDEIALGIRGCFGRICDGDDSEPLQRAYSRMLCIDDQNREWQQPYFAINPDAKRVMVELQPDALDFGVDAMLTEREPAESSP